MNLLPILAALICGIIAGLAFSLADNREQQREIEELSADLNAYRVMAEWDKFETERTK